MPRAVLDPNVLISAFITPQGASARLLVAAREGAFEIIVSPRLLEELGTVLRRPKFRRYATVEEADAYVSYLRTIGIPWDDPPPSAQRLSEDPDDEYLIDLARDARVDALVSGDPHLLALRPSIPVRGPREFLESLDPRAGGA